MGALFLPGILDLNRHRLVLVVQGQGLPFPDVHVHQDPVPGEVELIYLLTELAVQPRQLQPVGLQALVGLQDQQGIGVGRRRWPGSAPSTWKPSGP